MARALWSAALALGLTLGGVGTAGAQEAKKPQAAAGAQEAQTNGPKKLNPFTGDSAAIAEGRKLWFKYNCYGCHGTEGGGGMGASVIDSNWLYGGDDPSVFNAIQNGAGRMPALGQIASIPDEEIWKIIAYMRSLYKGEPDKVVW